MRKKVYIAGPITMGCLKTNLDQATDAFVRLARAGFAPMCPHWSAYCKPAFYFPGDNHPERQVFCEATVSGNPDMGHDDWMGIDLPWVAASDALLRLPGLSTGADKEVAQAEAGNIPVFHSIEGLLAYFGKA